jgi:hypothetical protein
MDFLFILIGKSSVTDPDPGSVAFVPPWIRDEYFLDSGSDVYRTYDALLHSNKRISGSKIKHPGSAKLGEYFRREIHTAAILHQSSSGVSNKERRISLCRYCTGTCVRWVKKRCSIVEVDYFPRVSGYYFPMESYFL